MKPTTFRFSEVFKEMIALLMDERHFNDRTAYFEQLVRDDWDKRVTPQMQAKLTAFIEKKALAHTPKPPSPSPVVAASDGGGGGRIPAKRNRRNLKKQFGKG